MRTFRQQARLAGMLYTIVAVTAPLGLIYVPDRLIQSGDAGATAQAIRTSPDLLRAGIASELVHQAVEVWLVLALYRLFAPIDRRHADALALLGLIAIPIVFLNTLNEAAALLLQSGLGYLSTFSAAQLDTLTMICMRLHNVGFQIAGVFWGLWLFPFGAAVIRCGFIPRPLGYLLWLAGTGYLLDSTVTLVLPRLMHPGLDIAQILTLGEPPIILWLLLAGARKGRADEPLPA